MIVKSKKVSNLHLLQNQKAKFKLKTSSPRPRSVPPNTWPASSNILMTQFSIWIIGDNHWHWIRVKFDSESSCI